MRSNFVIADLVRAQATRMTWTFLARQTEVVETGEFIEGTSASTAKHEGPPRGAEDTVPGEPEFEYVSGTDTERGYRRGKLGLGLVVGVVVLILDQITARLISGRIGVQANKRGRNQVIGQEEGDRERGGETDVSRQEDGGTEDGGRYDHKRSRELPPHLVLGSEFKAADILGSLRLLTSRIADEAGSQCEGRAGKGSGGRPRSCPDSP
jgi:hypothetical protein